MKTSAVFDKLRAMEEKDPLFETRPENSFTRKQFQQLFNLSRGQAQTRLSLRMERGQIEKHGRGPMSYYTITEKRIDGASKPASKRAAR